MKEKPQQSVADGVPPAAADALRYRSGASTGAVPGAVPGTFSLSLMYKPLIPPYPLIPGGGGCGGLHPVRQDNFHTTGFTLAFVYGVGYTISMKTAISLPDDIFDEAEHYARRAKMNRSRLYNEALTEYLARHSPDEVTEAMNHVVDRLQESPDRFSTLAAKRTLERVEW